jgi:pyruvate/2-oxoglutarate/acetoin dehydrogenase E1 component
MPQNEWLRQHCHDLRSALSAALMDAQTLELLDTKHAGQSLEKRLVVVQRAQEALRRATEIVKRIEAEAGLE